MNIGFISHSAELAGAERSLLEAAEAMIGAGARVSVCLPRRGPMCGRLADLGVNYSVIPYRWWAVRYQKSLPARAARQAVSCAGVIFIARYLAASKCDVVFTNSETVYSGAVAARLLRKPHVWQLREYPDSWRFDFGGPVSAAIMRRTTDCFVANSKAVKKSYLSRLKDSKIRVVYPCVNTKETRERHRPGGGTVRCLVAGTLAPHKNQHEVIEAIHLLRKDNFAISLEMLGDVAGGLDGYRRRLEEIIHEYELQDTVHFRGFVDDPLSSIAGADLLVQASREPFGRTVVEAMSVGTPVIASECGAAPELIANGETGLLYEPGNAADLAACIRRAAENQEETGRMASAARVSAGTRFGAAAFRENLIAVIESVL